MIRLNLFALLLLPPLCLPAQWVQLTTPTQTAIFQSLTVLDDDHVIVAGVEGLDGIIIASSDGGATWATSHPPIQDLRYIDGDNNHSAVATSLTQGIMSTDAGLSWTPVTTPGLSILDVFLLSPSRIYLGQYWVTPTQGGLNTSVDSCQSWDSLPDLSNGTANQFYKIWFFSATHGLAMVAEDAQSSQVLYCKRTTNGGQTWSAVQMNTTSAAFDLFFPTRLTGYVALGEQIAKTTDRGISWTNLPVPVSNNYNTLSFVDANTGFVFSQTLANVQRTNNGGLTWAATTHPALPGYINKIRCTPNGVCYACSQSGFVMKLDLSALGVNEAAASNASVTVIPQPVDDQCEVVIQFEAPHHEEAFLSLSDASGKTVLSTSLLLQGVETHWHWNAGEWPAGMYFLKIQHASGTEVQRIAVF